MFALLLPVLVLMAASAAPPAAEQVLLTVYSEPEDGLLHELVLVYDDARRVRQIVRRSRVDSTATTVEAIIQAPVVLARTRGRDAIRLGCPGCDPARGGRIELHYLHNGITGRFKVLALQASRGADGLFRLQGADGRDVHRLRLRSRTLLGFLIGVDGIDVE